MITAGSLFTGIGGFDLGLERAGFTIEWQSEIDPHACAVLRKHWPDVPNHGDICAIDPLSLTPVDLICGGFPCQDISVAGAGAGIGGERSGLWREFIRIVGGVRSRYALVENVGALTSRGLATVLGDFAALGYDAEWHVVPAATIDAPHLRERCFIVAYLADADVPRCGDSGEGEAWSSQSPRRHATDPRVGSLAADADSAGLRLDEQWPARRWDDVRDRGHGIAVDTGAPRHAADTDSGRCEVLGLAHERTQQRAPGHEPHRLLPNGSRDPADATSERMEGHRPARFEVAFAPTLARLFGRDDAGAHWHHGPTAPPLRRVDDGVPARLDRGRLRTLGNAVVPAIAEIFGQAIREHARGGW